MKVNKTESSFFGKLENAGQHKEEIKNICSSLTRQKPVSCLRTQELRAAVSAPRRLGRRLHRGVFIVVHLQRSAIRLQFLPSSLACLAGVLSRPELRRFVGRISVCFPLFFIFSLESWLVCFTSYQRKTHRFKNTERTQKVSTLVTSLPCTPAPPDSGRAPWQRPCDSLSCFWSGLSPHFRRCVRPSLDQLWTGGAVCGCHPAPSPPPYSLHPPSPARRFSLLVVYTIPTM